MTPTDQPALVSRTARLDDLPFTRRHASLLGGSGIGWALDAFDVGLISFVLAQLSVTWSSDASALSWVASAGFLGMAIGAAVGGLLADRLGRKQVFALTLLLYGLATGFSALSMTVGVLLVLRFVVGLGLGAELPVASTLVSEFAPRRIRGRIVVILDAFWAVGWVGAALVGYLVIPGSPDGWRWALLIGAAPALWAVFVRLRMPESVRFLEFKGRHDEAEAVVRSFEASAGVDQPVLSGSSSDVRRVRPTRVSGLFSPLLRRRTLAIWSVWFFVNFAYYGAFIWLPTLLVSAGFPLVKSFEFTLIITLAQLPGYAASAYLVEKWGRRVTLSTFLVGSAIAAAAFGFGAVSGSEAQIIVFGMLLSFFNLGAWGALYAVTPELYPTALRGTGAGAAAASAASRRFSRHCPCRLCCCWAALRCFSSCSRSSSCSGLPPPLRCRSSRASRYPSRGGAAAAAPGMPSRTRRLCTTPARRRGSPVRATVLVDRCAVPFTTPAVRTRNQRLTGLRRETVRIAGVMKGQRR